LSIFWWDSEDLSYLGLWRGGDKLKFAGLKKHYFQVLDAL